MRVLVCCPGTCNHSAGFSDAWFAALRPWTRAYGDGVIGKTRFEVLWSDLIQDAPWLGQVWAGCSAGFFQYLYDLSTREAIIKRFFDVVQPLLDGNCCIDLLLHSEGTIIGYEGARACTLTKNMGIVLNIFTLGTALGYAWNPLVPGSNVRDHLLPQNSDGMMPEIANWWWNIVAENDPFGSPLRPAYGATEDFTGLPAVGCSSVPPEPLCIHSSYFNPQNTAVLRDILADKINGSI